MIDFVKLKNIIQDKDADIAYLADIFDTNVEVLVVDKGLEQIEAEKQVIKDLAKETGLSFDEIAAFVDKAKAYGAM